MESCNLSEANLKFLAILALFISITAQSAPVEVITLQYKRAEEVIPVIQPFLSKGGSVSGMGNQLILRTTNLRDIRKILDSIDRAPRNLRVTVYQGERLQDEDAKTYSTESNDENASYVRVLEGSPAYIRMEKSVQENTVFFGPYGSGVSAQYREASRGFYVLAQLSGGNVTVEASPMFDRPVEGGIELQRLSTKVSGRVGEWMELGGIEQNLDTGSIHTADSRKIWIRVDLP